MKTLWVCTQESDVGTALLARQQHGVCALLLGQDNVAVMRELTGRYPTHQIIDDDLECQQYLTAILSSIQSDNISISIPLDIQGSPFQLEVWAALQTIPRGQTISYEALANRIGRRSAVRAVANACGANPLAILIPCHRVITKSGKLGGYRWGIEIKKHLLQREQVTIPGDF